MPYYVYGVMSANADPDFGSDSGIELIRHGGLAAIVRAMASPPSELEPAALLGHQRVLEQAMAAETVLPCVFGLLAEGEEQVRTLLTEAAVPLNDALQRLGGKEEVGLKVFWRKEAMAAEVEREVGDLAALQARAADPKGGRMIALQVGQRVEACLERWKVSLVPRIREALRGLCVDMRQNEPFGYRMLLNDAFLVERSQRWAFAEKVTHLDARFGDKLEFKYVAGLPPYNFVDLRISLGSQRG